MNRTRLRLLTGAMVLGTSALGLLPVARAAGTTVLKATNESWYQPNPTCAQATGCVTPYGVTSAAPGVPASQYPPGTLHIGVAAGAETARTYLRYPVSAQTGALTSARLDIPLDLVQADGNSRPETSHIVVCLASGAVLPSDGSVEQPPRTDCAKSAKLTYVATPAPHLTGDLAPLRTGLAAGDALALLPDGTAVMPTDAWQVVFNAHDRPATATGAATGPASGPATLSITTVAVAAQNPGTPVNDIPSDRPATSSTVITPPVGSGFASGPSAAGGLAVPPRVPSSDPLVAGAAPATAVPTTNQTPLRTSAQLVRLPVGAAYPLIWLLPIVLLALIPFLGKTFLLDLTPREDLS